MSGYGLASGLILEDIDDMVDSAFNPALFCRLLSWGPVAEGDKELKLRDEVFREEEGLIVFNTFSHISKEFIIVFDLDWMTQEIHSFTNVVTCNSQLHRCIDAVDETSEVIHQRDKTHFIEAADVDSVHLKAAAIAAVS